MTVAELASELRDGKACFDQALIEKTKTDRAYVAAASRLNILDRQVKQVDHRALVAKRAAAKALFLRA
jgi:hypothetical protein